VSEPVRIGDATLYCGDCLEILPTLGPVDAVVTDPPYSIPTQVASGREITRSVGDLSVIETAFRVYFGQWFSGLSEEGRAFVFCDGTSYPVIFRASFGNFSQALLIWNKKQIGMGREFRKSHELILHAWKRGTPIFSDGIGRADILECAPVPSESRVHPAEKPVDLVSDLLRVCGATILDPFMGSGTTGVACARLGRNFIGIEIEPRYFDIACERIAREYAQLKLFPPNEPKGSPVQLELNHGQ
jgi:DNA modification methylase